MSRLCVRCGPGSLYDDAEPFCPVDLGELVPYEAPAPQPTAGNASGTPPNGNGATGPAGTAGAAAWDRSACWNCGTRPPHESNTECLNPNCRRSLTPPALVLRFAAGQVEVAPGSSAVIGRLGPHGALFDAHLNVSRRHAVVGAESDGRAWIEPAVTPNGTFLDGAEIPAAQRRPLHTGVRVRFARDVEGTATVYAHR